jgi:hypothetical protein
MVLFFSCTRRFCNVDICDKKNVSTDCKNFIDKIIYMSATCSVVSKRLQRGKAGGIGGMGVVLNIYTGISKKY